jgi:hypothetical protein
MQSRLIFSINHSGYRLWLENVPTAVIASAVLHTLAIDLKLPDIDEGDLIDDQPPQQENVDALQQQNIEKSERQKRTAGTNKRNAMAARFRVD